MILTLDVTAPQAARLGRTSRGVFSAEGGSIGREKSNTWVLPHARVSARHAVISYANAVFYLEDTSTNGVFINSPKNRLVRGQRYALNSGDRIYIDPYEINVSVTSDQNEAALRAFVDVSQSYAAGAVGSANPFETRRPVAPPRSALQAPAGPPPAAGGSGPEPVPGEEVDPLKLLEPGPITPAPRKAPSAGELGSSPLAAHYRPPEVLRPAVPAPPAPPAGAPLIPPDYDPLAPDDPEDVTPAPPSAPPAADAPPLDVLVPEPANDALTNEAPAIEAPTNEAPTQDAPPSREPAPPSAAPPRAASEAVDAPPAPEASASPRDSDLQSVLEGAGLEGVPVTPELARSFGQILRVVVSGVMDVLRARQQIKDEFRMRMTQFRPADNNPLKFSANVDDALHNLLVKRNRAYLGPVEAFEDAFDDLRTHQLAVLAGMRVAFESMLGQFDPDHLQQEFDRQLKRGVLPAVASKLHYWDLYRDRQNAIAKDPDVSFRRLFGEEFARAYEELLNRLEADRRRKRS